MNMTATEYDNKSDLVAGEIGPAPQTPEWYDMRVYNGERERPVVFGASEAASALNMNPYTGGPLELYLRKLGKMQPIEDTDAMRLGRKLEPVIIDEYSERENKKVAVMLPMYLHTKHSFMGATPDGLVLADEEARKADFGLEIKASNFRMRDGTGEHQHRFGREGTDEVPSIYLIQAQQQMEVMGLDRIDLPVLFDGRTLIVYTVQRNEVLINLLVEAEKELAERIANDDPPEPNWAHAATRECIRELWGFDEKSACELSNDEAFYAAQARAINDQIKALDAQLTALNNRVVYSMKDASVGLLPDNSGEVARVAIRETYWTEDDIEKAKVNLGKVKRRGYERLTYKKPKK